MRDDIEMSDAGCDGGSSSLGVASTNGEHGGTEGDEGLPSRSGMRRLPLIAAICVVVIVAVLTVGMTLTEAPPDLVGLKKDDALGRLEAEQLFTARLVYDQTAPGVKGSVVSQKPAGGARTFGSEIVLTIAGPETVVVPDLTGNIEEASVFGDETLKQLEDSGLTLGTVQGETSYDNLIGCIMSQSPAAGRRVAYGAPVSVKVALRDPLEAQLLGEWRRVDASTPEQTMRWTLLNDYTHVNGFGRADMWSLKPHGMLTILGSSQVFVVERDGNYLNVWEGRKSGKPTRRYELVGTVEPFPPSPDLSAFAD